MASTKKKAKASATENNALNVEPTTESVEATTLSAADRAFLQRVSRFLVNVQSVKYLRRARREGYTQEEHKRGWELWALGSGMTRPLEHWFDEQANEAHADDIAADRMQLLQELDAFENKWLPRARAIIRRVVPKASRDTFANAFFKDMAQQPLGPLVVGSVKMFVGRVEELAKSKEPGAKALLAKLRERGLTEKKLTSVRLLLKEAEEGAGSAPKANVSAGELAKARAAQFEAVEDLRDWFNDVATMLRPVFGARDQIVLGLTVIRASRGEVDDESGEGEASDQQGDEPAAAEAAPKAGSASKKPKSG